MKMPAREYKQYAVDTGFHIRIDIHTGEIFAIKEANGKWTTKMSKRQLGMLHELKARIVQAMHAPVPQSGN